MRAWPIISARTRTAVARDPELQLAHCRPSPFAQLVPDLDRVTGTARVIALGQGLGLIIIT